MGVICKVLSLIFVTGAVTVGAMIGLIISTIKKLIKNIFGSRDME